MKALGVLLSAAFAALVVALAPFGHADIAIWVPGAGAAGSPNWDVMRRVPAGYTLEQLDYPDGLWPWTGLNSATGAQSIAAGTPLLDTMISTALGQGKVIVIGESLGSLVVDEELRKLADDPAAPDPSQLQFMVLADPSRTGGLFSYLPTGSRELLTGGVTEPVPVTPYNITVIKLQYDAIASFPDRPWHLLADLNALAGAMVYHGTDHYGRAAQMVLNGEVPPENITTSTNAKGGTTTTYTIQQEPALTHLLEPFFPKSVAVLDKILTPMIALGYSELTPDAGPHLAPGGALVDRNGQPVFDRKRTVKSTAVSPRKQALPSRAVGTGGSRRVAAKSTPPSAGSDRRPGR
ncbi:PE-PPE domain-containing protein [Mycolicibacterium pallens]|uniref:PE-PPE domain-containing protein n=1 Tax=Mycolicibacterium pallens TaxID=370524 RepID=A0ABX8VA52_9MYCO|nr:PE-PPE domain-containing protein [Mycolicibacterium pallens]APE14837.1 hypothetical protein BOH72_06020 [Mycobacterium sp. WY10]QYL14666.1 PE-PPE domain-containing protein [Mycolicibacterium pallens]